MNLKGGRNAALFAACGPVPRTDGTLARCRRMGAGGSKKVVYAAVAGNLLVAVSKFAAAAWTGSSAMVSEAIHSLVDTGNQVLLLYGMQRAEKPPDERHPLGYGRELYFWSFIVSLLIFMIGAGVSFYEGVSRIANPHPISDVYVSYAVLGASAVFEGGTFLVALREFAKAKGSVGYFEAVKRSKNPPVFIVLFEDAAALIGLAIAFAGTFAAAHWSMPIFDGIAALGISILLAGAAAVLARESKGLLIGESASPRVRDSVLAIAQAEPGIEQARIVSTVHLAPDQIIVALALEFADNLMTEQIETIVDRLDHAIREKHPEIIAVFASPRPAGPLHYGRRRLLQQA
jgi:cation diffusion facilitator family transporter